MTAGLPVGPSALPRALVTLILTFTLAACGDDSGGSADSRAQPMGIRSSSSGYVDTRRPRVYITSPLPLLVYRTADPQLRFSGTARDNVSVTRVTWENDRGGSGEAAGTSAWSASGIVLAPGTNRITVRAYDGAGNSARAVLITNYTGTAAAPVVQSPPTAPSVQEPTTSPVVIPPPPAPEPIVQAPPAPDPVPPPPVEPPPVEPPPPNQAPVIAGVPATTVVSGTAYAFTPTASDPEGQVLAFSVTGAPAWASFNAATGRLSGTPGPGDVGTTAAIRISVSDGLSVATLPAFSIAVTQNASGSATVSWTPPVQRTDGSALTDLAGYRIRYGNSPTTLSQTIDVPGASLTRYVVEGLTAGTWHFGVVAYDTGGRESDLSNLASKQIL
jgi:outer membrane biosynthesis protein TonB